MKKISYIPFTLVVVFISVFLLDSCGGGKAGADDSGEANPDTVGMIKVTPQSFPVNALPDTYFGKAVSESEGNPDDFSLMANDLTEIGEGYPQWLDAIVSRESIVVFATQILAQMPDEIEFVQTIQKHYQGADAWRGFNIQFTTKPSNVNILILGAYQNEDKSYWMSMVEKEAISLRLEHIAPEEESVVVKGSINDTPFVTTIQKERVKLQRQKSFTSNTHL